MWITTSCGKFLKIWEYQSTLPSTEKPVCGQEVTKRDMEQLTGSKLGKENENSLFILYAEYII